MVFCFGLASAGDVTSFRPEARCIALRHADRQRINEEEVRARLFAGFGKVIRCQRVEKGWRSSLKWI
jgi:hypothetical protein